MTFSVPMYMGTFLPTSVSPLLTTRFVNVLHWVAELHDRQIREVHNVPYISHLLSVAALTIEKGVILLPGEWLEDAAIVALMHHSIVDAGLPMELFGQIGGTVQDAMRLLCDESAVAKGHNRRYVDRLMAATEPTATVAQLVAAADQLDQLRFYADHGRDLWNPEQHAFYLYFLNHIGMPVSWKTEMTGLLEELQRSGVRPSGPNAGQSSLSATAVPLSLPTGYCPV